MIQRQQAASLQACASIDVAHLWHKYFIVLKYNDLFLSVTEEVAGSSPVARAILRSKTWAEVTERNGLLSLDLPQNNNPLEPAVFLTSLPHSGSLCGEFVASLIRPDHRV